MGVCVLDYNDNVVSYLFNVFFIFGILWVFLMGKISYFFGFFGLLVMFDIVCLLLVVVIDVVCKVIIYGDCMSVIVGGVFIFISLYFY